MFAVAGGAFALATSPAAAPADAGTTFVPVAHSAPIPAQVDPTQAGPTLLPSVEPVAPEPAVSDAGELVKAVQLAEQEIARAAAAAEGKAAAQAKTAAQQKVAVGSPDCGMSTAGLGAVKAHVRVAAEFLGCLFGEPRLIGVAGRAGASDHPSGLAVDFMVDRGTGDALAACALRNKEALGITYVIWRQRIDTGSGWTPMADRGSATANHMDHVHVSFATGAGNGALKGC